MARVRRILWPWVLGLLLIGAATGCFLRLVLATTVVDSVREEVDLTIQTVMEAGDLAICRDSPFATRGVECSYVFGGRIETSTFSLFADFGLLGVLIDPLILQVPDSVSNVSGTYDDGTGPAPLVVIQTPSFAAQTGVDVSAEAGQTFLIFELPADVAQQVATDPGSLAFTFTANFSVPDTVPTPISVKPMLTVRANIAGHIFYLPQIPCVTDFASVPAVAIPVPATGADLGPAIAAAFAGATGCQNEPYSVFGVSLDHHHFLGWKAKSDTKPSATLTVTDALGSRDVDLVKTALLATPADHNLADPNAPLSPEHLVAYKVKRAAGQPAEAKRKGVAVANLAGSQTLDLKRPDRLLLPAAADLAGPVPPLAAPGVNAFSCWKAKYAKGSEKAEKGLQHLVQDPFSLATYAIVKPTRLCLPADVDGADPGAENDSVALLCFKAKSAKPRPPGRDGVHSSDAVGAQILRLKKTAELCFPSTFLL